MFVQVNGKTAIGLRYSEDGSSVNVYLMRAGIWDQRWFSIRDIVAKAQDWDKLRKQEVIKEEMPPSDSATTHLHQSDIAKGLTSHFLVQYWNLSQWWQKLDATIPDRYSHVFLFNHELTTVQTWTVVQSYTSADRPLGSQFVIELTNPVILHTNGHAMPLVGPSFNHLAWIEEGEERTGPFGRKTKRRALKFVCFPDPDIPEENSDYSSAPLVKTLDVPGRVLDNAYHLFVEPSLGGIIITSTSDEMHRIFYA